MTHNRDAHGNQLDAEGGAMQNVMGVKPGVTLAEPDAEAVAEMNVYLAAQTAVRSKGVDGSS